MTLIDTIRTALKAGDPAAICLCCSIIREVKIVSLTDEEVQTLVDLRKQYDN